MKNILKITNVGRTAAMILLASSISTIYAQGNGNNQPAGQAIATATNVVVTNTSAQPVPVTVTNPASSSVTINNTAAQPVPVKNRDDGAYQPFYLARTLSLTSAIGTNVYSDPVPAGKRLVIDSVSAQVTIQQSIGATASVILGGGYMEGPIWYAVFLPVPLTYAFSPDLSSSEWVGTTSSRTYIEPGKPFVIGLTRGVDANGNRTGSVYAHIYVIGHYVDIQ